MTPRDNLIAALDGRRPERIPYTINQEFVTGDPAWERLFESGLCPIPYVHTVREEMTGVERVVEPVRWQGQHARRVILRTPMGDISQIEVNGWVQEYYLKSPADYRAMAHIVRNTRLTLDPAGFEAAERQVGDRGLALVGVGRSPMQTILVDFAGLEAFSYHMADGFPELFELAEALEAQLLERCRLTAAGPGRFISLLENFTAESWGAARFRQYHLPVYAKLLPIFAAAGKRVFPHCDGQLDCVAEALAGTEFAGIESLTEPPEGDMTLMRARGAFRDKVFWANINVGVYALPMEEFRRWVRERVQAAAPDGCGLVFEISEDLPANWREAIPVALEVLRCEAQSVKVQ
ncbi:MAG: hypothetical protein WCL44_10860 [bacterium]